MTGSDPDRPDRNAAPEAVPDDILRSGLRRALGLGEDAGLQILARAANPYASSSATETVTVEVDGARHVLFCKYEAERTPPAGHHRRGVAHEARVYEELLAPARAGVPRFRGTWRTPDGALCLVLDAVDDALPIAKSGNERLVAAAHWLGSFHAATSRLSAEPAAGFLPRYDHAHMVGWLRRAQACAEREGLALPWLDGVAYVFHVRAALLARAGQTMVHGEFYPNNVLATADALWAVDWESAGAGPGEIDLASLTMGWPRDVEDACIAAYAHARWGGAEPPGLRTNVATARLYLVLRMLGDSRARPHRPGRPFFPYLHEQARALGFLPHGDG